MRQNLAKDQICFNLNTLHKLDKALVRIWKFSSFLQIRSGQTFLLPRRGVSIDEEGERCVEGIVAFAQQPVLPNLPVVQQSFAVFAIRRRLGLIRFHGNIDNRLKLNGMTISEVNSLSPSKQPPSPLSWRMTLKVPLRNFAFNPFVNQNHAFIPSQMFGISQDERPKFMVKFGLSVNKIRLETCRRSTQRLNDGKGQHSRPTNHLLLGRTKEIPRLWLSMVLPLLNQNGPKQSPDSPGKSADL